MNIGNLQSNYFNRTSYIPSKSAAQSLESPKGSVSAEVQDYRDYFDAIAQRLNQTNNKDKPTLSEEQLKQLKDKYGSDDMTYDEYQSFLDDLVKMGALTNEDKYRLGGVIQAGGLDLVPVAYTNNAAFTPLKSDATSSSTPYSLTRESDTNIADWVKFRASLDTFYFDSKGNQQNDNVTDIFAYVSGILSDMRKTV